MIQDKQQSEYFVISAKQRDDWNKAHDYELYSIIFSVKCYLNLKAIANRW